MQVVQLITIMSTSTTSPAVSVKNKRQRQLLVQQKDELLIIKINCPDKKNALNRYAIYELIAAVEKATNNPVIKVVIITAVGDIFTAGNDLKQIADYKTPEDYYRGANYVLKALVKTFLACPKLLICLVNGPCIGIGFTLAALCDAVYCTNNAYFQAPFSQLGICPEAASTYTFPQQFGLSWSTKLLIFGEQLPAAKAEQLGFVLQVYEQNNERELEEKFWHKMREYCKLPRDSLRISKRLMRQSYKEQLLTAMEEELKELEILRRGADYKKAVERFMLKSANKSKL